MPIHIKKHCFSYQFEYGWGMVRLGKWLNDLLVSGRLSFLKREALERTGMVLGNNVKKIFGNRGRFCLV